MSCSRRDSQLKEVLVRTLVSDSIANIQTTSNPPIYLQANRKYELAMVNLVTYYSFANIREGDNNSFKWSVDDGITILPNVNTLQCILTVVGAKCTVSSDVPNALASVLGFKWSIYGVGRYASENLINIMNVNSILVHCNIIHSSYMRGIQVPVAYNFFPNAAPGQKILEAAHNLIYIPVTVDVISTLSVWLTDQHGNLLDLRGEELTIRFQLRER